MGITWVDFSKCWGSNVIEKRSVKFFQICVAGGVIFGLDGQGRIWAWLNERWGLVPMPEEEVKVHERPKDQPPKETEKNVL